MSKTIWTLCMLSIIYGIGWVMTRIMHRNDIYEHELLRLSSILASHGDSINGLHSIQTICDLNRCTDIHYTTMGMIQIQRGEFLLAINSCNKATQPGSCAHLPALQCLQTAHQHLEQYTQANELNRQIAVCQTEADRSSKRGTFFPAFFASALGEGEGISEDAVSAEGDAVENTEIGEHNEAEPTKAHADSLTHRTPSIPSPSFAKPDREAADASLDSREVAHSVNEEATRAEDTAHQGFATHVTLVAGETVKFSAAEADIVEETAQIVADPVLAVPDVAGSSQDVADRVDLQFLAPEPPAEVLAKDATGAAAEMLTLDSTAAAVEAAATATGEAAGTEALDDSVTATSTTATTTSAAPSDSSIAADPATSADKAAASQHPAIPSAHAAATGDAQVPDALPDASSSTTSSTTTASSAKANPQLASLRAYYGLGVAYLSRGESQAAVKQMDKVVKKLGSCVDKRTNTRDEDSCRLLADALLLRGRVFVSQGDSLKGSEDLLLLWQPDGADAGNSTVFGELLALLDAAARTGDEALARSLYGPLKSSLPQPLSLHLLLALAQVLPVEDAIALLQQEEAAAAARAVETQEQEASAETRTRAAGERDRLVCLSLASLYEEAGRSDKAVEQYDRAISRGWVTHMDLGAMYERMGMFAQALVPYQHHLQLLEQEPTPDNRKHAHTAARKIGEVYRRIGGVHAAMLKSGDGGQLDEARRCYQQAMSRGVYDADMRRFFASTSSFPPTPASSASDTQDQGTESDSIPAPEPTALPSLNPVPLPPNTSRWAAKGVHPTKASRIPEGVRGEAKDWPTPEEMEASLSPQSGGSVLEDLWE